MEVTCVVCAEAVNWVAYGECGHLDVCAICIARLRFVCSNRHCCICKSLSPFVFVTKIQMDRDPGRKCEVGWNVEIALGPLTRVINDFSVLPAYVKDGKLGSYWFLEGIQAYFDDFDAYKIFKDLCRLSCTACDKSEAESKQASKKTSKIKNIEQLKDHLSRRHELFFCSLCLANKKVFICEQKLYSRVQLRQHMRYGDSEVDGCKSERCGFSGHPYCEFCQTPFYGDNELYFHMSTEHYTCHICEREHPTQYQYYKDYDDLEIHFRQAHFLCEDDECLDKKFIVFDTEADLKEHAALEHGGNIARSKCNASLQLPTCIHFGEREEEGYSISTHTSGPSLSSSQISSAISSYTEGTRSNVLHGPIETSHISSSANSVPPLGQQGPAMDFRGVLLNGPSFPPLPSSSNRRRYKPKKNPRRAGQTALDLLQNPSSLSRVPSHSLRSLNAGSGSHSGPPVLTQSGTLIVGHYPSSSSTNPSNHLNSPSSGVYSASSDSLSNSSSNQVDSSSAAFEFVDGGSLALSACRVRSLNRDDVQAANKSMVENIRAALGFNVEKFDVFKKISKDYLAGEIEAGEYLSCVHQFGLENLILDLARFCPDPQKQNELMETYKSRLVGFMETGLPRESGNKSTQKGKEKCEDFETSKRDTSAAGLVNHMKEVKVTAKPFKESSSSNGMDPTVKGKSTSPAESQGKVVANTSATTKMPKIPASDSQSQVMAKNSAVTEVPEILPKNSISKDDVGSSNGDISNYGPVTTAPGGEQKLKKSSKFLKNRLGESSASMADSQSQGMAKNSAVTEIPEILLKDSISIDDVGSSNGGISTYGPVTTAPGGEKKLKKSSKFLKNRLGESSASMVSNLKVKDLPSDLMVVRPNHDSILASVRGVWRNNGGRRLVTITEASPCTR
ncbi:hypothetical protein KSS87_020775 [Heliosperma pusillum]|nr:hypothetical protein KSS87_020775 [Heliosperma pusillum]